MRPRATTRNGLPICRVLGQQLGDLGPRLLDLREIEFDRQPAQG